jgi:large subunit ribosomal protein L9
MKVILKEDIIKVGFRNEVVKVKNGYGRNYLIPQKKAVLATESALKVLAENVKQQAKKEEQIVAGAKEVASKLQDTTLSIGTKAGSNGKIFGSVTTIQIAKALKDAGHDIERKRISIKSDIKELGKYKADIKLHKEVQFELELDVVRE